MLFFCSLAETEKGQFKRSDCASEYEKVQYKISIGENNVQETGDEKAQINNYTDSETNLLFCGKCHTHKQCRVTLFGKEKLMPCNCKCRQEQLAAEEQARKEQQDLCRCLYCKRPHRAGHTRSYDELFKDTQQPIGYVLRGQKQVPCQFWRV